VYSTGEECGGTSVGSGSGGADSERGDKLPPPVL
jgi:hypothetical protein